MLYLDFLLGDLGFKAMVSLSKVSYVSKEKMVTLLNNFND